MKTALIITSLTSLAVLVNVLYILSGVVYAFHEGGEGYCEGCHYIHEYPENYLLKGADASSTCLQCHAQQGRYYSVLSTDGSIFSPGGDFYWLKKTFSRSNQDTVYYSFGDTHGHNIVAAEYGLKADSKLTSAPGGAYPSSAMGCSSCHNPHGVPLDSDIQSLPFSETGNFRLLGGIGYNGSSQAGGITFVSPAPVAGANSHNWTETDNNHTAYGYGMSEWCCNCHTGFLNNGNKHPSGNYLKLGSAMISNYNSYIKTGNISGVRANSYLSLVPFELGTTDTAHLDPSSTSGPVSAESANVMCLTCHRAHASAFYNKGRWDFQTTFIIDSMPGYGDGGVTGNDVFNSYYGRNMLSEFGEYQRQFCNKCHLRD